MATRPRGAPHPAGSDPNDAVSWLTQLATWVDDRPGVAALTTTQRNALSGVDRWDGKLVLDTTLDRLFRWDAGTTTWIQVADFAEIAALLATTGTPAAIGTASRGVSTSAARADHVHPGPAWTAWTPVLSGFALQAGAQAFMQQIGAAGSKTTHLSIMGVLAGAVTGVMSITPPVAPARAPINLMAIGTALALDVGTGWHHAVVGFDLAGAAIRFFPNNTGAAWQATNPFTWQAGDTISLQATYESA